VIVILVLDDCSQAFMSVAKTDDDNNALPTTDIFQTPLIFGVAVSREM
jgi:hypothetical protein